MAKSIRSRALLGAAAVAFAPAGLLATAAVSSAHAQSAVGSVFGYAGAGEEVTITNASTGLRLTTTAASDGHFQFTQLAPGTYNVSSASGSQDVVVKVGTGTPVALGGDNIVVVGSGVGVNPLDVSSVESTTIFTDEDLRNLPIPQDISSVALLAPGTVQAGHPNFGNLVSVGGSSVAENGYYINGFDVTNIRKFLSFADLPFQAIAQQQIKTGGYGAEFGRSLGGVINLVTKRGTNDWQFGASVQWSPESLYSRDKDVLSNDPLDYDAADPFHYYVFDSADRRSRLKYTGYVGGPIIEDRIFFFGIVQMRDDETNLFGRETSSYIENTSPTGLVKLDINVTDGHTLEFTGIYNRESDEYIDYNASGMGVYYSDAHIGTPTTYEIKTGGKVGIAKYTGRLTDNFTISAQYGYLDSLDGYQIPEVPDPAGAACVRAFDSQANPATVTYVGCYNTSQLFIPDPDAGPDEDVRKAIRADAEWLVGDHKIRFGYDREKFSSSKRGEVYTGGSYWRHFQVGAAETTTSTACTGSVGDPGRCVNGVQVAQGQTYARQWVYATESSSYDIINQAFYLEDSWQITPEFLLYAGARLESFENRNGDGVAFVSSGYEWAPRAGFSWDVNGDSTLKVFANYGRYYIPVAANTNIRVSGVEYIAEEYFISTGFNSMTGLPTGLGGQLGPTNINGSLTPPNPNAVATANLSPMYQDEYILGVQKMLNDETMVGLRGIYRDLKSGMDDHCSLQPFQDWADDNGFGGTIDLSSISHCHIINPGQDVVLEFDADGMGPKLWTVDAEYFKLPALDRWYAAAELFWDYKGERLSLNGSYTLSWLKGNSEGYVNTDLGQTDAGLTQDWDNYLFTLGAYGYLNNDRRHSMKLFGTYDLSDEWQLGANVLVQSGRPISCLGYIDLTDPGVGVDAGDLAFYSASSFNCTDPDTLVKEVRDRGSYGRTEWSWKMDASLAYRPDFAEGRLGFRVDAFNIFNNQKVTRVQQSSETGSASTPIVSPNFLNALEHQSPRYVRFTLTYDYN